MMDRSANLPKKNRRTVAAEARESSEELQSARISPFITSRTIPLYAILVIITLTAFWGTFSNSFISADDNVYVYENERVQKGVTWDNLKWAFSTDYFGFYYPLTWLSHMLDCELFGVWAGGHHLTSLLIHLFSTILLFAFLLRTSGLEWRSFAVAALFAVHPLHVESVAWVAERKDVLSAFFWLLGIVAYVRYVEKPGAGRYTLVFFSYVFGLLAKPMIITFPFTLLLLDFWPLKRLMAVNRGEEGTTALIKGQGGKRLSRLIWEKAPLFALVPLFAVVTFQAQKQAEAVSSIGALPLDQRILNALASYVAYTRKLFLPTDLSAYYPLSDNGISSGYAVFCGLFIIALTVMALFKGRKKGYWITGWFWYIGTLVPVIGVVQVGGQAMADRYTYIPLVGVFIVLVWAISDYAEIRRIPRYIVGVLFSVVLMILMVLARIQVGYWTDSMTLFSRALFLDKDNYFAHSVLGSQYLLKGDNEIAIAHLKEAVRLDPGYTVARYNLATALIKEANYAEAAEHYETSLKEKPDAAGMSNLGMALAKLGRNREAEDWLKKAVAMDPGLFDARLNLASVFSESGETAKAEEQYREALSINPGSAAALNGYGQLLLKSGRRSLAIDQFRKAVLADSDFFAARINLGKTLEEQGAFGEALEQFKEAIRIKPDDAETLNTLGLALAGQGRMEDAASAFQKAVEKAPEVAEARINLGYALLKLGKTAEAEEQFRKALLINPRSDLARMNLLEAQRLRDRNDKK